MGVRVPSRSHSRWRLFLVIAGSAALGVGVLIAVSLARLLPLSQRWVVKSLSQYYGSYVTPASADSGFVKSAIPKGLRTAIGAGGDEFGLTRTVNALLERNGTEEYSLRPA